MCAKCNTFIRIDDAKIDPTPLAKEFIEKNDIEQIFAFPVSVADEVIGVILLGTRERIDWRLVEDKAPKLSLLLGRLFQEARLSQESQFLAEMARRCAEPKQHTTEFYNNLADFFSGYFKCRGCSILITHEVSGDLQFVGSTNRDNVSVFYNLTWGLTGYVARTKKPLRLINLGNRNELDKIDCELVPSPKYPDYPIESPENDRFLAVPILTGESGSLLGVLRLIREEAYLPFFPHEEDLLISAGLQLAIICRLTSLLAVREAEMQVLAGAKQAVEQKSRTEAYKILLDQSMALTHADNGYIAIPNLSRGEFAIIVEQNLPSEMRCIERRCTEGIIGLAFRTDTVVLCNSLKERREIKHDASDKWASEMAVPLREGKMVIGVLNLHSKHENKFGETHYDLIQLIASICLLSLRSFETERDRVRVLLGSLRNFHKCEVDTLDQMDEALKEILFDACSQFAAEQAIFVGLLSSGHLECVSLMQAPEEEELEAAVSLWDNIIRDDRRGVLYGQSDKSGMWRLNALVYRHSVPNVGKAYVCFMGANDFGTLDGETLAVADLFSEVLLATYTRIRVTHHAAMIKRALDQANSGQQIDKMSLGFGHEARNIVNNLLALMDVTIDEYKETNPSNEQDSLIKIQHGLMDLGNLTKKFLGYSRELEPSNVHLSDVVNIYSVLLRRSVAEVNMKLSVETVEHLSSKKSEYANNTIFADPSNIGQILGNLVANAVDARIGASGRIEITTKTGAPENRIGKWAVLEVRDYGCGIPKKLQNKVWNSGFSTKSSGNGLGLHIVKRLVDQNMGLIELESDENRGTSFKMYFPIGKKRGELND